VHSLELRLLAHTGAVGFGLFAVFLVMALRAARRARRTSSPRARVALGAALVAPTVWLVHGSFDWFWEIPALSGAAFACLGAAASFERHGDPAPGRARSTLQGARRVALAAIAVAAVLALGSAYLGELALQRTRALASWNPRAALRELAAAARLEPLSSAPATLAAAINLGHGEAGGAIAAAQAGLVRDSHSWLLWLEAGLADGAAGRLQAERTALSIAHTLDPAEPVIVAAQRRAGTAHPLTITQAASTFSTRIQSKLGR
jgi:hypothetical protein